MEQRNAWLTENARAFADQAVWHERTGHPLADIFASPLGATWREQMTRKESRAPI